MKKRASNGGQPTTPSGAHSQSRAQSSALPSSGQVRRARLSKRANGDSPPSRALAQPQISTVALVLLALTFALTILLAACGADSGQPSPLPTRAVASNIASDGTAGGAGETLAPGSWGGDHIRLTVTESGAALEFGCAHASITQPMVLHSAGTFDLPGLYTPEHGGPIHEGDILPSKNVRYTGAVSGATMQLTITYTADGTEQGTYPLKRDAPTQLHKCL